MSTEVVMPKLGLNMSEGMIAEWLKQEGDSVMQGDLLFIVETDKITTESEAQVEGVLAKILVAVGEVVPVSTPVAIIAAEGEELPGNETLTAFPGNQVVSAPQEKKLTIKAAQTRPTGKVLASPAAKRLAKEHGLNLSLIPGTGRYESIKKTDVEQILNRREQILPLKPLASPLAKRVAKELDIDLSAIVGTGKNGQITREDVERTSTEQKQSAMVTSTRQSVPIVGVRAIIAERMQLSTQQSAQVTLQTEVDATNLVNLRGGFQRMASSAEIEVPSYNALLISMVAQALSEYPRMNARQEGDAIQLLEEINVGLAVDTERGLLVVVVRDADQKTAVAIESELTGLTQRAHQGTSTLGELTGGTFTITNLGAFGVDSFTPIINPPEIGILGVGRIIEKPVMVDGQVLGRQMMILSMTFDHRLIDGAPAAKFLQRITQLVETG
jgi:pyruvate dehydrogenase E2 component (dihydrolipoamide acetyltransferase)